MRHVNLSDLTHHSGLACHCDLVRFIGTGRGHGVTRGGSLLCRRHLTEQRLVPVLPFPSRGDEPGRSAEPTRPAYGNRLPRYRGRSLWRDRQRPTRRPAGFSRRLEPALLGGDHRANGTDAVMPVEQRGELVRVIGREPEDHPGLTPRLFERIAHVAGDRWHGIGYQAVDDAPALPGPLERRRGLLRLEHQLRIPHGDPSLIATARSRRPAGPEAPHAAPSHVALSPLRRTIQRGGRLDAAVPPQRTGRHGDQYGLAATSSRGDYSKSLLDCNEIRGGLADRALRGFDADS